MIDPKALDAALIRLRAQIAAQLGDGDVIAMDGKALRRARDQGQSARTRMMASAYAARLRLTLAADPGGVAADNDGKLEAARRRRREGGGAKEAALNVLGLIALKGKFVTADALHCHRRTVAAITNGGGDYCLALRANQVERLQSCVAAPSTSFAAPHPRGRSRSN